MLKVLIADDEYDIRIGLCNLEEWGLCGFEVVGTCTNGLEAYKMFKEIRPHLLVVDIKMPVMDGIELLKKVREIDSEVAVIILSGYDDFEYAKEAIRYSASSYLLKPVDTGELLEELNKISAFLPKAQDATLIAKGTAAGNPPLEKKIDIQKVLNFIKLHFREDINLTYIAKRKFFFHPYYLGKLIKKETGYRFNDYLNMLRVEYAKKLLVGTEIPIKEISEKTGYKYLDHFYRTFKKYLDMNPGDYRERFHNKDY